MIDNAAAAHVIRKSSKLVLIWSPWWLKAINNARFVYKENVPGGIVGLNDYIILVSKKFLFEHSIRDVAMRLEFALQQSSRSMDIRVKNMRSKYPHVDDSLIALAQSLEINSDIENKFNYFDQATWNMFVRRSIDSSYIDEYDARLRPQLPKGSWLPEKLGLPTGKRAETYLDMLVDNSEQHEQEWLDNHDDLQSDSQDESQDVPQDDLQDESQDVPQDDLQDDSQDVPQDDLQDDSQDVPQDESQDVPQDDSQSESQDVPQDDSQSESQDVPQSDSQSDSQDDLQEGSQSDSQDDLHNDGTQQDDGTQQLEGFPVNMEDTNVGEGLFDSGVDSSIEGDNNTQSNVSNEIVDSSSIDNVGIDSELLTDVEYEEMFSEGFGNEDINIEESMSEEQSLDNLRDSFNMDKEGGVGDLPSSEEYMDSSDYKEDDSSNPEQVQGDERFVSYSDQIKNSSDENGRLDLQCPERPEEDEDLVGLNEDELKEIEKEIAEDIEESIKDFDLPGKRNSPITEHYSTWSKKKLKKPKASWKKIFPKLMQPVISQGKMEGKSDMSYSKRNPNQRNGPNEPILQGWVDFPPEITVLIDASPSMLQYKDTTMREFMGVLRTLFTKYAQPIAILLADSGIQYGTKSMSPYAAVMKKIGRTYSNSSAEFGDTLLKIMKKNVRVKGRYFNRPDILVVFTDCIFMWPLMDKKTLPRNYPKVMIISLKPYEEVEDILPMWVKNKKNFIYTED